MLAFMPLHGFFFFFCEIIFIFSSLSNCLTFSSVKLSSAEVAWTVALAHLQI